MTVIGATHPRQLNGDGQADKRSRWTPELQCSSHGCHRGWAQDDKCKMAVNVRTATRTARNRGNEQGGGRNTQVTAEMVGTSPLPPSPQLEGGVGRCVSADDSRW
jgi:hypothetical protein